MPRLRRKPVHMYGSAAGSRILKKRRAGDNPSTRPTFMYSAGIERTPSEVFITVGHMEHIAMVNVAAGSDFWNSTRPSGSQASGETGRKICAIGSNALAKVLETPSKKPNGTPSASASA